MSFAPALKLMPSRGQKAFGLALFLMVLGPLAVAGLSLCLGQDSNWDFRNYHWYNAYAFLNNRYAQDLLPSQTPYFYNPTLDLPYFLLATHLPIKVAAFILSLVQGLNFVLLFMLAHASLVIGNPRKKVWVCALLAGMGMLGAGSIAQIGTTFYDNITSLGVFLSALLVISWMKRFREAVFLKAFLLAFVAGIPAGLAMGLKLPSVIFCVALCGALLFISGSLARRLSIATAFGFGVLLGVAISLGHWAWFLQTNFGSPLFPYFNTIFKSPLAPLTSARDIQFLPQSISDFLFYPYIFAKYPMRVGEIIWRDLRIPALYTLLPLGLLFRFAFGKKAGGHDQIALTASAHYLLWVAALGYGAWLVMFSIYRYAVPLEMMTPLLIVFVMGFFPLHGSTRNLLTTVILVFLALTVQGGDWGHRPWKASAAPFNPPTIAEPSKTMILMAGFDPFSHVVPSFPSEVSFVRIQSNFASPDQNKSINRLLDERIQQHKKKGGRFMLLVSTGQKSYAPGALKYFSLTLMPKTCQTLDDPLYDKLDLCNVVQTP